jgi:hypothetical protein
LQAGVSQKAIFADLLKVKCLQETRIPGMLIIDSKTLV